MRLLIYGSKEFASTVAELVRHCGHEAVGMVDDYNSGPGIIGNLDSVVRTHPPEHHGIALAVGYSNLSARWAAWDRIRNAGYRAPALVHPRAYVADSAKLGDGVMVMAAAIVDVYAEIGELTVLWPGANVSHHSRVGPNTFLSPGATLCGFVDVGANSFIGAVAVLVDHTKVPEDSFIKAGSIYSIGYRKDDTFLAPDSGGNHER
jgi:sugar O-acyltransferase (sialic acid O-acetyltransferase NeuD family)